MPQIDLGKVRFAYKGTYSLLTEYEKNDVVTYNNDVYVYNYIAASTGNVPTDTTYWAKMVEGPIPQLVGDANKLLTTDGTNTLWTSNVTLSNGSFSTELTAPAGGTFVGSTAEAWGSTADLTDPIAVFRTDGGSDSYAQVSITNAEPTSSTDLILYSDNGVDAAGWVDLGITGSKFDSETFGITGQNDGYVFYQAPAPSGNKSVTNKQLTDNTATLTTSTDHGFLVGNRVVVTEVGSPFNGTYTISAVTTNTFSYVKTNTNISSAAVSPAGVAVVKSAGNLVIATGDNGSDNRIVFAAGGYASGNTQMIIIPDEQVHIEISTASTSPTTGALRVAGGVGITGDTFTDGDLTLDGILYVGPGAESFSTAATLTSPAIVTSIAGGEASFAQIAFHNEEPTSSTDIIVYMDNGDDSAGWMGMGIAGSEFDDTTFGITAPGDGYIFHNAIDTDYLGNMVFATGANGSENKIIFAAGGFDSGTTQMEITPGVNVHIEIATPSTSPTTGALTVVGGVGIQGDLNIDGSVAIQGTITFGGSGTTVETANLAVTDPAVFVGTNNQSDIVDLAFIGEYATTISTITASITNKSLSSNVATLTASSAHNFLVGDVVVVTSVDSTFNGTFNITAIGGGGTTFSYNKTASNVSSTAVSPSGSAQVSARRKFSGVARDASDGVIKFFKDATTKPTTTIDFSEAGLAFADIRANAITLASATIGDVSNTELQYLDGVTSAIQTQINAKANAASSALTGNATITASSGVPLTITNTGTGSSFLVEDAASTDSTPFVIDASGSVGIGVSAPAYKLDVRGGRSVFTNAENFAIGVTSASGTNGVWFGSGSADVLQWSDWGGAERMRLNAASSNPRLQLALNTVLEAPLVQNPQTGTSYTVALADAGKLVECSNTSAITVTVPLNSSVAYPVGTQIMLLQTNTGQVTVVGAGGVTINASPGLKLRTQWASATLIKRAENTWVLVGDITA